MTDKKKMGRPTSDPKNLRVSIRFNEQQSQKIKSYAEKKSMTTSEVIRKAVDELPE